MRILQAVFVSLFIIAICSPSQAQYFGKNKPRYKSFDFHVCQTPHFEIYHYLDNNEEYLNTLANQSERWFEMHNQVFQDSFLFKNPLIFYNNHADFQQTRAISGGVSVGTGGVTEALKNRVILPFAMSNQQTHHVLGHELVHAFQYHSIIYGDSTSLRNMANLPLWIVEGLAEYMSLGSKDAHTAMWMRDAVMNDRVPTLEDLYNPAFFPYRYGQAFWSFLTGKYGDDVIRPFFSNIAKFGLNDAIRFTLVEEPDTLSNMWVQAIKSHYAPYVEGKKDNLIGKRLLSEKNSGRMNISPVLSPNGRYVAFLSEKDLFSIDVFLADARSGKIIRKLASTFRDGHFDDFNYIESAGTWSPNSKEFAVVGFKKGVNAILVKDIETGRTTREITIPEIPAFSNISWSPDGKSIVLAGLVNGQIDLYQYFLKDGKVIQLTDNTASEMQPYWSSDGNTIVFASDQLSEERGLVEGKWTFNIAELDIASKNVEIHDIFYGADNLNPVYDHQDNILFVSNRDGFRNLYKYDRESEKVSQMTDLLVGISGITHYSPAISASRKRDRILYSYFTQGKYTIYQTQDERFLNQEVDPMDVQMGAATLPPGTRTTNEIVNPNIAQLESVPFEEVESVVNIDYNPKFKLDYVGGGTGIAVGSNNNFGTTTGLAGGVDLWFSDILGNNKLYSTLSVNGEIYDFGGQVAYVNEKNKIAWGGILSHIPYRYFLNDGFILEEEIVPGIFANRFDTKLIRLFEDRVGLFAQLPFSSIYRVEAGASFSYYSTREERISNYYDLSGFYIGQEREKVESSFDPYSLYNAYLAYVGDNSVFGLASPIKGHRFRVSAEQYGGEFDFTSLTLDGRKYFYAKPFTLAGRFLHYGRYGGETDLLRSLYIGNQLLMRGFSSDDIGTVVTSDDLTINQLLGSKIITTNFEVRVPFTGPEQLALLKSKFLFSELAIFLDVGAAYDDFKDFNENEMVLNAFNEIVEVPKARWVSSTGLSLRINVFGAIILEPYYFIPLTGNHASGFGLNIIPGW
ncbi:MAG: PD40 domain-containing protein [Bacteroidia bacterium]|nr:PD40 domain-containing protein [Bacteroidia bacterium]